ncbi:Ribosomal protein L21 [Gracilaria domingensis]|nr:Ribosomal protein L21 [Gracilaria domingensis]
MLRTAWRSLCCDAMSSGRKTLRTNVNRLSSTPSSQALPSFQFTLSNLGSYRRQFCSSAFASEEYHTEGLHSSSSVAPRQIERVPLPPGLNNDKFGLYEILDSGQDVRDVKGRNAVVAIHGPTEVWLPKGIEGHGASGGMWAVIATSGTQYKVMKGDVLYTNRQVGEVNTQVAFDSVLAIGAFDWTLFGRPAIRSAKVLATIEEQTKSAKVMVSKFKKRKGYSRRKGHRQPITRFRIDDIVYDWPDAEMIKPYKVPFCPKRPPLPNHVRPL